MKHLAQLLSSLFVLFAGERLLAQGLFRVSVSSTQAQSDGASGKPSISGDGRYIAFSSSATNLVGGDTNAASDVFVYDVQTGAIVRASLTYLGAEGNGGSNAPSISADGRFVAFVSSATNLVADDTNGASDVFLRDIQTGRTSRVSVASGGGQGNGFSYLATISADARYVAFTSAATNLVTGDTNGQQDVFVRDFLAGVTSRVSVDSSGVEGNSGSTYHSISADGRYVAFASTATNLVSGDTNASQDIFVRDLQAGVTVSATVDPNWVIGNLGSALPSISADGRFVAFQSDATNLVLGDTNGTTDIFVRDMQTTTFVRLSVDSSGSEALGLSNSASISADARYVVFESNATNLVSGDTNGKTDVFLHDGLTGTTTRINLDPAGGEANDQSAAYPIAISTDGHRVAFGSDASNLVAGDTNGVADVFLYDPLPCGGYPIYCTAKMNSQGCLPSMCASGVPSYLGPDNFYVTGLHVLNNKSGMLLWSYSQDNHPFHGGTLCVGSPIHRTPLQNSGGSSGVNDCTGGYSFWFSQAYMTAKGIAAGAVVRVVRRGRRH
jgi:Tol biopolymer transport system component